MWIMLKEPINDGRRFEFQFYKTAGNAIGNYIDIRTKGLNQNPAIVTGKQIGRAHV